MRIELRILSGSRRGESVQVEAPILIGRHSGAGLSLSEPGVWERHAEISCAPDGRMHLRAVGEGAVSVDSKPIRETVLRSGDRVSLGSVTLEFRLAVAGQRGLEIPERLVWTLLLGAALVQVAVLGWLARP